MNENAETSAAVTREGGVSPAFRRGLLIFAAVIFAASVIWLILLETKSSDNDYGYLNGVCERINLFGYDISPENLYINYRSFDEDEVCISRVLDGDPNVDELVRLSKECGFPSDVNRSGRVELYFEPIDRDRNIVIWLVNDEPELVYIHNAATKEYSSLKGK